jgi:hypothetical protein
MHTNFFSENLKGTFTRESRRRWKNNIEMDFIEKAYDGMDLIQLAQERCCEDK